MIQGGDADGYLLFNKRPGQTSFKALSEIKRALGTRRVGHCGTLDSFAEGLLLVFAGRSTRLVQWFSGCDKLYEATVLFGSQTDTLDPEGPVIATADPPSLEALTEALEPFRGHILQAPPLYSAIHIDGKRAYELARKGIEVEMEKRPVTIQELTLISYEAPLARIRVRCSKGTYIRSLARDIAIVAGSRAHLVALKRLEVSGFVLDDACSTDGTEDGYEKIRAAFKPVDRAAFDAIGIPTFTVEEALAPLVHHGKPIDPSWIQLPADVTGLLALFDTGGTFLACLEGEKGAWRYGYVV